MLDLSVLPAFIGVIVLFLAPPGPDMAYVVAVGLERGRGAAVAAILGIGTAMTLYATSAALGVGQLARSHPELLDAVKILGAAYLLWLSVTTWRGARAAAGHTSATATGRAYGKGFVVAVTNPKIILFFLAVLPQFVGDATSTTAQLVMLGAINVAMEVVLYGTIGVLAGTFHARFTAREGGGTALGYVAAAVYLVLAAAILLELLTR